jgi:hypothetical protein
MAELMRVVEVVDQSLSDDYWFARSPVAAASPWRFRSYSAMCFSVCECIIPWTGPVSAAVKGIMSHGSMPTRIANHPCPAL